MASLLGCFSGESTLGASCREHADCGAELGCTNEVCGRCGDGLAQRGELCLVSAAEVFGAPPMTGELRAGDLDGDATPELLVRGADGSPQVWARDGDGWSVLQALSGGGLRGPLRFSLLDDDERLDVVAVDEDALAVSLGFGDGTSWAFGAATMSTSPMVDLAVADAGSWAGPAWLSWVDAEGLRQAVVDVASRTLAEPVSLEASGTWWVSEAAPLDADDALDLAVVDGEARQLWIWLGDGGGGLVKGEPLVLEQRPAEVVATDVDGDGDFDLLVPDEDGGVTVLVGDGEGHFVATERVEASGRVRAVVVADLDRSTERDLVVLTDAEPALWVFLARGSRHPDGIALPVEGAVGSLVAVDFDRDGLTEVLLGPAQGVGALRVLEVEP